METKLQKVQDDVSQLQKEKDHLQEELNEKERQANSQDLVCHHIISVELTPEKY